MKKTVLFVVNHSAQLKAPLRLIILLKSSKKYKPLVYINFSGGWNLWKEIEICKDNDIAFICDEEGYKIINKGIAVKENAVSPYHAVPSQTEVNFRSRFKQKVVSIFSAWIQARYMRQKVKQLKKTLTDCKVDILVVPEDAYGIHALFVKAAKKLGIPSVLIPFTKSNHFELFSSHPVKRLHGISRIYCYFRSNWKINYKGGSYIPFDFSRVLAHELTGISPRQPFSIMGGKADIMLVENADDMNYYGACEIPCDKMVKTGAIYQDEFYHILRDFDSAKKLFYLKHDIKSSKPVMLCTLFPVATPVDADYGIYNYGTVRKAVEFWLKPLIQCDRFQLWVHHHPRTNRIFIDYIESWNLKVIHEPIESVMPFCDIVISGISATTRMALTLGKPILCYTEEVSFSDLDNYTGTVTVGAGEEYIDLINKLSNNETFFEILKRDAKLNMSNFGTLDGKAYQRILEVFDKVTKE